VKRKYKRLTFVAVGVGLMAASAGLVLTALDDSLSFFRSPTELVEQPELGERRVRLGGLVEEGSIERGDAGVIRFRVTDLVNGVAVSYQGLLPDLFREGQGVVAQGRLENGVFLADEILARHDENYMPAEVTDALKKSGQWQHAEPALEEASQMTPPPGASPGTLQGSYKGTQ
jgi:cytochrome c-type biogenesis protein CcmE